MVTSVLESRGIGWSVYDVANRRRLAGPFKGRVGKELAVKIAVALRDVSTDDTDTIEATIKNSQEK